MAGGRALIGLLRLPVVGSSFVETRDLDIYDNPELPDASLPYVMTNPDPDGVILRGSDLLFVLGNRATKNNPDTRLQHRNVHATWNRIVLFQLKTAVPER